MTDRLTAYTNVSLPSNSGEVRPATCYWKIDGQDLVTFTVWSPTNYDALRQAVTKLLEWSEENRQPLLIHVVDMAIPRNRDLIRLCGKTNSDLVWLKKDRYVTQFPEAPERNHAIGLGRNDDNNPASTA